MGITHEQVTDAVPGLLRYARALTRDPVAAEDLVQDTVVRALERAADFRGDSSPATWLHRILHHRFVDVVRAQRADPTDDDLLAERVESAWRADDYTVDAQVVLERAEDAAQLRDALEPPTCRRPTARPSSCTTSRDSTAAQVADIQQVSVAAAKQRISRGRAMLVSELARETQRRVALRGVPLRCWDARSRVGTTSTTSSPLAERAQLESHLAACPTCPALYTGLVGVRSALGSLRDPDTVVPAAIAERLRGGR